MRVRLSTVRHLVREELVRQGRVMKESADEEVKRAYEELRESMKHMSQMGKITPFSQWYKGDHKKAVVEAAKAARALSKVAKKSGMKELAREALDFGYAIRHGKSRGDEWHTITSLVNGASGMEVTSEGMACDVCGHEHLPYWSDDDDAELEPQGNRFIPPRPHGFEYKEM